MGTAGKYVRETFFLFLEGIYVKRNCETILY
jgi:hypothetical protein